MNEFTPNPAPQGEAPAPSQAPQGAPQGQPSGVPSIPEGGDPKYYNAQTGDYNWRAEAIEHRFRQTQRPNGQQANPQAPQAPNGASQADHNALVENLTRAVASGKDGLQERMQLLQAGVPEAMIESYAQAVQVSQQARFQEAIGYAGGPEKVNSMKSWVAQNLSPEERAGVNQQLNSGNWKMAIDYINARMGNQTSNAPNVDMASTGGVTNGAPFSSQAELASAINTRNEQGQRLYDVDPTYRQGIQRRAAMSRY